MNDYNMVLETAITFGDAARAIEKRFNGVLRGEEGFAKSHLTDYDAEVICKANTLVCGFDPFSGRNVTFSYQFELLVGGAFRKRADELGFNRIPLDDRKKMYRYLSGMESNVYPEALLKLRKLLSDVSGDLLSKLVSMKN